MFLLYMVTDEATVAKVGFLNESPQDPESYVGGKDHGGGEGRERYPSYWAWDEWKKFKEAYGMKEYHFDQGPFGHVKTKPTTVGTNMEMLEQLDGVRGAGSDKGPMETNLEARMAASKKWAAWAPGMKKAIAMTVRLTVEQVKLKRLSAEQWRAHLANDHLPFHRGCRTCLEGAGKARYHRRVVSPESYTLAIDLAGPFKPGRDQEGVGRYIVVGTYTVPVTRKGRMLMDLAPERLTWLEGPGQGEVPEVVREMRRWKKRDYDVVKLRGTGAGGPAWRFVRWRLSVDLDTHEILESKSMIGEDQKAMRTGIDKERNLLTLHGALLPGGGWRVGGTAGGR